MTERENHLLGNHDEDGKEQDPLGDTLAEEWLETLGGKFWQS